MAKTSGHGNAFWTRDETILALDLLMELEYKVNDKHDPRVVALSEYLRSLPIHPPEKKNESFRNPDGVAFKMQNLNSVRTEKGLKNVSQMDREVWNQLGKKPGKVHELAAKIRASNKALVALRLEAGDVDDDEEFAEGATATKLHRLRERSRSLRKRFLAKRMKAGKLRCDACEQDGPSFGHTYTQAMFEAHHTLPLATSGQTTTKLSDLALLCANCHRLIHRTMVVQQRWIGVPEFRKLLAQEGKRLLQKAA
jgi:5-methylcytosine-specific restriction enzyme A